MEMSSIPVYDYNRRIEIGRSSPNIRRTRRQNRILTTKYAWYTFLPLVLYEQFQKISNFYFLIVLIVNVLADVPAPFYTSVTPLAILVTFAFISKAYEDVKRFNSDKEWNEQRTLVLRGNRFVECTFQELNIGDVVKCVNDSFFPADILLLFSSRDSNDCSVTTANLDGESSLKTFHGSINIMDDRKVVRYFGDNYVTLNCVDPCDDLYKFHGRLDINGSANGCVVNERNLLLRGARLKNTDFVVGCVVYAGAETKLSMNSKQKKPKVTSVELQLNKFVIAYLCAQVSISIAFCIIWNVGYFNEEWAMRHWYVPAGRIDKWPKINSFFAFFIVTSKLLPISLIYSIYTLKAAAVLFMNYDIEMYDKDMDERCRINTIELAEELGQIEYLFTDKTGTLTENNMKFSCCSTGRKLYKSINDELHSVLKFGETVQMSKNYPSELVDLFKCLCLCHTANVPLNTSDDLVNIHNINPNEIMYQASSPDEEAFLYAIRNYGICYLGANKDKHYLSVFGEIEVYTMIEILEFDSVRKCMSVIVEKPDDTICVICKGAENSLFEKASDNSQIDLFSERLTAFSVEGLRILVVGKRNISKKKTNKFLKKLKYYRSNPTLVERISEIYCYLERDFDLIGVTGVEDKLQQNVPETITKLKEAGIKIWVITGDKEETALNISMSAGHISSAMQVHRLTNVSTIEECMHRLTDIFELLLHRTTKSTSHALIVDGKTFSYLVQPVLLNQFVKLCSHIEAAICCRMNPLQKAQTVNLIKLNVKPPPIVAAIGDGGNDVSMIMEAHVGIGIFGKEGRQAIRVADYAIGKFYFLQRAILIHGQNFYIRLTSLIDFYFYKSVMYVVCLLLYAGFSAFSAIIIYDTVVITLYNITFTTIPLLIFGIFDKKYSDNIPLESPQLYSKIKRNSRMSFKKLLTTTLRGIGQSFTVFIIVFILYSVSDFTGREGHTYDYLFFGCIVFYSLWGIIYAKLILISHIFTWIHVFFFTGNALFCIGGQLIFQKFTTMQEFSMLVNTFSEPFSWLVVPLIIGICLIPDIIWKVREELFHDRKQKVPVLYA